MARRFVQAAASVAVLGAFVEVVSLAMRLARQPSDVLMLGAVLLVIGISGGSTWALARIWRVR